MLNIMKLFKPGRYEIIKLDTREDIREEHIQNSLKNYHGPLL